MLFRLKLQHDGTNNHDLCMQHHAQSAVAKAALTTATCVMAMYSGSWSAGPRLVHALHEQYCDPSAAQSVVKSPVDVSV